MLVTDVPQNKPPPSFLDVVVQTHPSTLSKFAYSYFVVFSPVRKQKTEIFHSAYFT